MDMSYMFQKFNQPLDDWNTLISQLVIGTCLLIRKIRSMFIWALVFQPILKNWDVSSENITLMRAT